jgi:hypothetical protein
MLVYAYSVDLFELTRDSNFLFFLLPLYPPNKFLKTRRKNKKANFCFSLLEFARHNVLEAFEVRVYQYLSRYKQKPQLSAAEARRNFTQ